MNIALMAHDRKKELMVQFCIAYCGILAEHSLCATHVTGKLVSEATGLPITLYLHADQGGAQQIGSRISYNEIDHEYGVNQALIGNIGHVALAKQAGMEVRGDFGLNAFNSQTLDVLRAAGFLSATASFELRIQQIRDMQKPLDTEMIIYGRLPVMVSDQCIIRAVFPDFLCFCA